MLSGCAAAGGFEPPLPGAVETEGWRPERRSRLGSPERGAGSPNGLTEGFSCSVYGQTPPPHVRSAPPLTRRGMGATRQHIPKNAEPLSGALHFLCPAARKNLKLFKKCCILFVRTVLYSWYSVRVGRPGLPLGADKFPTNKRENAGVFRKIRRFRAEFSGIGCLLFVFKIYCRYFSCL